MSVPGPRPLVLLGGGGHAAVVADAALAQGWDLQGFFDDRAEARLFNLTHLGSIGAARLRSGTKVRQAAIHAAVGDNRLREKWLRESVLPRMIIATIVHPSAIVSPRAKIGEGVFVGPGAIVNARARIERGVIINSGAIVEHDVEVGQYAHIAPGAVIGGEACIEARVLIGIGARVLPGIRICEGTILGGGAVAVAHIPSHTTAVGVPARAIPAD